MPLKPFARETDGTDRKIFLLKPRGFCAGVVRAIDVVKIALDLYGPPVYVRKEIVHNKHVVDELRSAGAVFVEELEEVPPGARAIRVRSGIWLGAGGWRQRPALLRRRLRPARHLVTLVPPASSAAVIRADIRSARSPKAPSSGQRRCPAPCE